VATNSQKVKDWRKRFKQKIILLFNGSCNVCGYDRCNEALEFHHLDPSKKDFSFGAIRANPKNFSSIIDELRKCIMVCANCHREIHYGLIEVENKVYLNDEILDSDGKFSDEICVCGEKKMPSTQYCSRSCASSNSYSSRKISYSEVLEVVRLRDEMNLKFSEISEIVNFSESCISKQYRKFKNTR